jgi:hypothetical protein
LFYNDGGEAKAIIGDFKPVMTKDSYLAFAGGLFKKGRYSGVGVNRAYWG